MTPSTHLKRFTVEAHKALFVEGLIQINYLWWAVNSTNPRSKERKWQEQQINA